VNKSRLKIWEKRERACAYAETAEIFSVPPIISGTGKATNFKFGRRIHKVHANKSPLKIGDKRDCGHIQGLHKLFEYPYYLRNGQSYELQILQVYSQRPCEQLAA